jgi:hypothetical protein
LPYLWVFLRTDDSLPVPNRIESLHRISWTDVSSTCKAAVALLGLLTSDMFSRYSLLVSVVRSRPMVIARSVKLLSLFSLIFSSGLCFGYSSWWWYVVERSHHSPAVCFQLAVNRSHHAPRRLWHLHKSASVLCHASQSHDCLCKATKFTSYGLALQ